MKSIKRLQNIEDTRKECGSYNYANPNNYWQSFYDQKKSH